MAALKYCVIHCLATPAGRHITPQQVVQWHQGPKQNKDGTLTFLGVKYPNRAAIPAQVIGGQSVRSPHFFGNGWDRVGYQQLILLDGTVHEFVKSNRNTIVEKHEVTWGAIGESLDGSEKRAANWLSMHIAYVGGLSADLRTPQDTRTVAQKARMKDIMFDVLSYAPNILFLGHNQLDAKACPSFYVPDFCNEIGIPSKNISTRNPYPSITAPLRTKA